MLQDQGSNIFLDNSGKEADKVLKQADVASHAEKSNYISKMFSTHY